jgi:hypothetical protein
MSHLEVLSRYVTLVLAEEEGGWDRTSREEKERSVTIEQKVK